VLNEHLTADDFVEDLQELYPAAGGNLVLVLEGSNPMAPRQFLRYMMTTVAYTPEVEDGVCVPKLLGGGNDIKVVYEGLELTQDTPRRQPMVLERATPFATRMGNLATEVDSLQTSENPESSASSRAVVKRTRAQARSHPPRPPSANTRAAVKRERTLSHPPCPPSASIRAAVKINGVVKRNRTQARSHPPCPGPTHDNANHVLNIFLVQERSILPAVSFPSIRLGNVPKSGGPQECLWLESEVLARLPEWIDRSTVKLGFARSLCHVRADSRITWNEDSFRWSEDCKYWALHITACISW